METTMPESETVESPSSVGRLISELMRDVGTLFRQEMDLARAELAGKAGAAKAGVLKIGIAAGTGLVGVFVLAAAAVLGLTLLLSLWMAPLVAAFVGALAVGAALALGAYLLYRRGVEEVQVRTFVPERTLESLKENAQWASRQLH
jgi:hypothetical protein